MSSDSRLLCTHSFRHIPFHWMRRQGPRQSRFYRHGRNSQSDGVILAVRRDQNCIVCGGFPRRGQDGVNFAGLRPVLSGPRVFPSVAVISRSFRHCTGHGADLFLPFHRPCQRLRKLHLCRRQAPSGHRISPMHSAIKTRSNRHKSYSPAFSPTSFCLCPEHALSCGIQKGCAASPGDFSAFCQGANISTRPA